MESHSAMTSVSELGLDMNNPSTLAYYSQMLLFRNDASQAAISFDNPTKSEQRVLQSLAHALDLEYDHNTLLRQALVSRTSVLGGNTEILGSPGEAPGLANSNPVDESNDSSNFDGFKATQPVWDNRPNESMHLTSLSNCLIEEGDIQPPDILPIDWSTTRIDNLQMSPARQDFMPAFFDNLSVDYSIDTVPSLSETSGIGRISSASELYSSRDLSSHDLHGGDARSSSIRSNDCSVHTNDRRGSFQSIHKAISEFFDSHQTDSTTASTHSLHGEWSQSRSRVEKSTSRRPSVQSLISSGFSCFDSKSGSQVSVGSGHRVPLGRLGRATKRVVTAVKACWRCKVLRKACNPETPCTACPSDARRSDWHSLGCKRGEIKDHMLPVVLCPNSEIATEVRPHESLIRPESTEEVAAAGDVSRQALEERARCIQNLKAGYYSQPLEGFFRDINMSIRELDMLRGTPVPSSSLTLMVSPSMVPLDDCILMIIWELVSAPNLQSVHIGWTIQEFFNFLVSAAICQVDSGNQLIAQSFICLRTCLEALHVQSVGQLSETCHQSCAPFSCNIECISNIEAHITHYIDELSRVFFSKKNMRDIKIWWMSGFYSLCIQSIVRRALLQLLDGGSETGMTARYLGVKHFLQVAVRLFVASSRVHDPLVRDLPPLCDRTLTEEELGQINECKLAQVSVKQATWKENGIKGSGGYLKWLFDDDNQALLTSTAEAGAGDLYPEVDSSFKPYSWITKFDTVFLIADSTSMIDSGSWNAVSGALSSVMFLVNRYHNYGIDIHFDNHMSLGPGSPLEGIAAGGYYGVKNIATITELFKSINPAGSSPINGRFSEIIAPYLAKLELALSVGDKVRPLNVIIIGNSMNHDGFESEFKLLDQTLDQIQAPRQQVGVQLFKIQHQTNGVRAFALINGEQESIGRVDNFRNLMSVSEEIGNGHLTGEKILTTNLEAWLKLLES